MDSRRIKSIEADFFTTNPRSPIDLDPAGLDPSTGRPGKVDNLRCIRPCRSTCNTEIAKSHDRTNQVRGTGWIADGQLKQ